MSLIVAKPHPTDKDSPILLKTCEGHPDWFISLEDAEELYNSLGKAISDLAERKNKVSPRRADLCINCGHYFKEHWVQDCLLVKFVPDRCELLDMEIDCAERCVCDRYIPKVKE